MKGERYRMKIEMIGYNDTKTIAIYSSIKMLPFLIVSFIVSLLSLIPLFIFKIYELLYIFILPGLLLFIIVFQYVINSNYKNYLKGSKTKHIFCLEDGTLYKDKKEIKSISDIRLYKFRRFLFLELKQSYYRIMNEDFISGSREEFLSQLRFYPKHYIAFNLPPKTEEEIETLIFSQIETEGKERLFYSLDKRKIIYIYKNSVGSYSIGRETMFIECDEERCYSGKYGWWEPIWNDPTISFYGTLEEALKGIEEEIKDYDELEF